MSKNTREFITKARYSQNDSNAVLVWALMPFGAKIANHQSRRCGRNDTRQVQMIGEQITAVGNDGGQSDLNLRIVNRLRDLASRVPHAKPIAAPPTTAKRNCPIPFPPPSPPATTPAKRIWKTTTAVPSFKRLSPSIMTESRLSILRSLKMASTEMDP